MNLTRIARALVLVFGLLAVQPLCAAVFYVNSTDDLPDDTPADGVCKTTAGTCTLRAAIMQANATGGAGIVLPAGTFTLTRAGTDDVAYVGDLDITQDVTIQGAGSASTIIDGNGANIHDRVFHIMNTATEVIISGITIRNGSTNADGSGIYHDGEIPNQGTGVPRELRLFDVVIENNDSLEGYGGGIYSTGGSVEINNSVIRNNTAGADGSAIFIGSSRPDTSLIMRDCKVYGNTNAYAAISLLCYYSQGVASGIHAQIVRSETNNNTGTGFGHFGAAAVGASDITITDSSIHDNTSTTNGGGLVLIDQVLLTLTRTTIHRNHADKQGGGIYLLNRTTAADRSLVILDSCTISSNTATHGAGIYYNDEKAKGSVTLRNSTVSDNAAYHYVALNDPAGAESIEGGGIYLEGSARMALCSATVFNNTNNQPLRLPHYTAHGAGLIAWGFATCEIDLQNSIVANNVDNDNLQSLPAEDDIYQDSTIGGIIRSEGYNLIRGTSGYQLSGTTFGVINNQDPLLGPLQDNGGATLTREPQAGSPVIDTANPNATDEVPASSFASPTPSPFPSPQPLTVDQRGATRPVNNRADMGAVEVQPNNATPTPTPVPTPVPTPTPLPTPVPTPTPTPTATASPTPTATPTPPSQLLNLSTRQQVGIGDNVLIGGFIVVGTDAKKVMLRGLGPSLPVDAPLADPVLELHNTQSTIATNDNWKDTQPDAINATGIAPTNDAESAIVATLEAKAREQGGAGYTGVLFGKNSTSGIGLLEIYDLDNAANSKLANISTRGLVGSADDVLIGGFIPGPGDRAPITVLVRALGPSLTAQGVSGALQDPVLELHDANGTLITNDNWREAGNAADIQATGIPPTDDHESAILTTLVPSTSGYTAIVRGANGATGVGLVEVYGLN
jgi:CSLREA domain-containing protein